MGIISLNEKRTATSPLLTTGKEVSYRAAHSFGEVLQDPYFSGKFYYWHDNGSSAGGRFGAFWDTGTTEQSVIFKPVGGTGWYERSTRYHTNNSSNWTSFTIDLSSVTSPGRLVFYAAKNTNKFNSDFDLDDMTLHAANGTTVNFDPSADAPNENTVRPGNLWQRYGGTARVISSYSTAKSQYLNYGFEDIPASGVTSGKWNHINGHGGGSTGTGSDNAADDDSQTKYLYWEGSSGGSAVSGGGSYLRFNSQYNLLTGAIA